MSKRNDVVLGLVLALGLVTTGLGVAYGVAVLGPGRSAASVQDSVLAAVVGALGAGIVGAAASTWISRLADREGRDDLNAILFRTLGSRFTSSENELSFLRTTWHHYHVTSAEDQLVWRHHVLRLDGPSGIGSVSATVPVADGRGNKFLYTVEAGVRGTHAVLLFTSEALGVGAQSTEVFPAFATRGYQQVHAGVGFYEMWNGRPVVGRTLMLLEPVGDSRSETVSDNDVAQLNALWEQHQTVEGSSVMPPADAPKTLSNKPPRPQRTPRNMDKMP